MSGARIDWGSGRILGFSVPEGDATLFDVVQLLVDGQCLVSAVANLSVFEFATELAGLPLPSREQSAFALRIPQASLLPDHITPGALLEVRTARGSTVFSQTLRGLHQLLQLTDGAPADLLYDIQVRGLRAGAVQGVVVDRHGSGMRPVLKVRLNDRPAELLPIYESAADGSLHHFAVPLRPEHLLAGPNLLHILSASEQPLLSYPIQIGGGGNDDAERRIAALEAEVAFLKHLVLTQGGESVGARMALMKSEIVALCSDMLALQRTNLEREIRAERALQAPAAQG
jgi:hypothetical protein